MVTNDFGGRNKSFEAAVRQARRNVGIDPMPWKTILAKSKTSIAMAIAIRIHTMRNVTTVETIHYKDPTYVVQWVVDNEKLAREIEECKDTITASRIIRDKIGIHKLV